MRGRRFAGRAHDEGYCGAEIFSSTFAAEQARAFACAASRRFEFWAGRFDRFTACWMNVLIDPSVSTISESRGIAAPIHDGD
jgi:hypothetical protein